MKTNSKIEEQQKLMRYAERLLDITNSAQDLLKRIEKKEIDPKAANKLFNSLNKELSGFIVEEKTLPKQKKVSGK